MSGGLLPDFLTFGLQQKAAKKQQALQQALLNQNAQISATEFARRMQELGASNSQIADLVKQQYGETAANQDSTFSSLLSNNQQGFDEQQKISGDTYDAKLGNAQKYFDDQITAETGLTTAQKQARIDQKAISDAELARQQGFQSQADALGAALPGQVGFQAQETGRSAAETGRNDLAAANTTQAVVPAFATGDSGLAAAFAGQQARGTTAGVQDAARQAHLSAYSDAFQGSERKLGTAATDLSMLGDKAQISRSALPAELAVGDLAKTDAQQKYDFASALSKQMGDKYDQIIGDKGTADSKNAGDFHTALGTAKQTYGDNISKTLSDYFGGRLDAQGNYINGVTAASSDLENKLINLNNFKMGATQVTSPAAALVGMLNNAATEAAKAYAQGGG